MTYQHGEWTGFYNSSKSLCMDLPHPGPIILAAREQRGWSQSLLAERAETTAATVSRIETQDSRGRAATLKRIAIALDLDPRALYGQEDVRPPVEGLQRHYVRNTIDGVDVRGTFAATGATSETADLAYSLTHVHLHRSEIDEAKTVYVAGVPDHCELAELRSPVEVRIGGMIIERYPPGWLFVLDPTAEPQSNEIVVVEKASSATEGGYSELRRFEVGNRGLRLLFELGSDEFVTESKGWRIVGVVVDKRPAPRH